MEKKPRKIRYSEIFKSIQGEGKYTGIPTVWLRLWGCNFECAGFGQKDLDRPETWELPFADFDEKSVVRIEQLPVWHTGCDSSYSWAKKFVNLAHFETAEEIAEKLISVNKSIYNSDGKFFHDKSKQETHFAFTGGEPMMNQLGMIDVMEALIELDNIPINITVETNGTQDLRDELAQFIGTKFYAPSNYGGLNISPDRGVKEWFWSVSPKLYTSGEKFSDAIKPDVVASYAEVGGNGQLKYVVNGDDRTWYEVDKATDMYREAGIDWPVFIMPVGADEEMQRDHAARIADAAMERGFNVAARVHVYLYGNVIGK